MNIRQTRRLSSICSIFLHRTAPSWTLCTLRIPSKQSFSTSRIIRPLMSLLVCRRQKLCSSPNLEKFAHVTFFTVDENGALHEVTDKSVYQKALPVPEERGFFIEESQSWPSWWRKDSMSNLYSPIFLWWAELVLPPGRAHNTFARGSPDSHGMCEHIDRYIPFFRFLALEGFVVCGNDHLGHGKPARILTILDSLQRKKDTSI